MADKRRPSEQQPPPGTMGPYKSKEQYPYDTSSERFVTGLQDESMDVQAGFPPKPLKPGEKYARGGKVGGHTVHNYCAGGKVISSKNH